jgi:ribosomal protein L35AE/L33A
MAFNQDVFMNPYDLKVGDEIYYVPSSGRVYIGEITAIHTTVLIKWQFDEHRPAMSYSFGDKAKWKYTELSCRK